jgi:hypothetical protein
MNAWRGTHRLMCSRNRLRDNAPDGFRNLRTVDDATAALSGRMLIYSLNRAQRPEATSRRLQAYAGETALAHKPPTAQVFAAQLGCDQPSYRLRATA